MPWFYNIEVESCELHVAIYDFEKINLRVVSSFITSCKVILRVANLFGMFEIKLVLKFEVATCFLRAVSCFLWVANLNKLLFALQAVFYKMKIKNFILRVLRVESLRR